MSWSDTKYNSIKVKANRNQYGGLCYRQTGPTQNTIRSRWKQIGTRAAGWSAWTTVRHKIQFDQGESKSERMDQRSPQRERSDTKYNSIKVKANRNGWHHKGLLPWGPTQNTIRSRWKQIGTPSGGTLAGLVVRHKIQFDQGESKSEPRASITCVAFGPTQNTIRSRWKQIGTDRYLWEEMLRVRHKIQFDQGESKSELLRPADRSLQRSDTKYNSIKVKANRNHSNNYGRGNAVRHKIQFDQGESKSERRLQCLSFGPRSDTKYNSIKVKANRNIKPYQQDFLSVRHKIQFDQGESKSEHNRQRDKNLPRSDTKYNSIKVKANRNSGNADSIPTAGPTQNTIRSRWKQIGTFKANYKAIFGVRHKIQFDQGESKSEPILLYIGDKYRSDTKYNSIKVKANRNQSRATFWMKRGPTQNTIRSRWKQIGTRPFLPSSKREVRHKIQFDQGESKSELPTPTTQDAKRSDTKYNSIKVKANRNTGIIDDAINGGPTQNTIRSRWKQIGTSNWVQPLRPSVRHKIQFDQGESKSELERATWDGTLRSDTKYNSIKVKANRNYDQMRILMMQGPTQNTIRSRWKQIGTQFRQRVYDPWVRHKIQFDQGESKSEPRRSLKRAPIGSDTKYNSIKVKANRNNNVTSLNS